MGSADKALRFARKAFFQAKSNPDLDILEAYHNISLCFYYTQEHKDSALHYWRLGYKESEFMKDSLKTFTFSSNLGAYYYGTGNYATARKMFSRAVEIATQKQLQSAILKNNIVSTLINQRKYDQALRYWKKNQDLLKVDFVTYSGQLFTINRVNLLQVCGKYGEAQVLVDSLKVADINKALEFDGKRVILQQELHNRNYSIFKDNSYLEFLKKNALSLTMMRSSLIQSIDIPLLKPFYLSLEEQFNENKSDSLKSSKLAKAAEILGSYYQNINVPKSNRFFQASSKFYNESRVIDSRIQARNLTELTDLEQTYIDVLRKESVIQKQIRKQKSLTWTLVALSVILVLVVVIFINRLKIKTIQKENSENEKKALEKENDLNNRMIEYSKVVIENTQNLKKQLSLITPHASETVAKQILQIQREMDGMGRINPENNPKIAQKIIEEKPELESKYPGFETMNKTEKRVFALWMENYSSKDIASMLNMSTQYVRNVKTRIRKKVEITEDWG